MLSNHSVYVLCIWPRCFSNCCLYAGTESEVSQDTLLPWRQASLVLKTRRYRGQSWCCPLGWKNQRKFQRLHFSRGPAQLWYPLHLWNATLSVWGLTRLCGCPRLVSMWLFLYILSCRDSFLLVFSLLSEIVALHVIVLVCFWEVRPGSNYSAILTRSSSIDLNCSVWSGDNSIYLSHTSISRRRMFAVKSLYSFARATI